MKLFNIIAFNDFYASIAQEEMNITVAYKLNRIIEATSKDMNFYNTELQKIFEDDVEKEGDQYKTTEDGMNFVLKPGKAQDFEKRFAELRQIEVDFNESYKIDIETLENFNITPLQLGQIQDFIK